MISPLRKRRLDGTPYVRFEDVERQLHELDEMAVAEIVARCDIQRTEPGFVHDQCLMHLVRRQWTAGSVDERLLGALLERVRRRLPRAGSLDGRTVSMVRLDVAEKVYDTFVAMLMGEVNGYDERLDFFEISLANGLASLSNSAHRQTGRIAGRREDLLNEEGDEVEPEVDEAVGTYDPFDPEVYDQFVYRSRLARAMSLLSPLERRIVEMCRQEIPISSKDPSAITMTNILNRSDKGIRNIRDRAFARLRRMMINGEIA